MQSCLGLLQGGLKSESCGLRFIGPSRGSSNIVVDTGGWGCCSPEKGGLPGHVISGTPEAVLRYRQAGKLEASAVTEAEQRVWEDMEKAE